MYFQGLVLSMSSTVFEDYTINSIMPTGHVQLALLNAFVHRFIGLKK